MVRHILHLLQVSSQILFCAHLERNQNKMFKTNIKWLLKNFAIGHGKLWMGILEMFLEIYRILL